MLVFVRDDGAAMSSAELAQSDFSNPTEQTFFYLGLAEAVKQKASAKEENDHNMLSCSSLLHNGV